MFLVDMKTISSLVTKKHQLQDQKSKHEPSSLSTYRYINTEVNMHFSLQREYFFRIISSTDESIILLPDKVCIDKLLFCNTLFSFWHGNERLFSFYFKWFVKTLNSDSHT